MWPLVLFFLLCSAAFGFAESGSPEKYDPRSNLFNPAKRFSPDNPLNPTEKYPAPANTPNPRYRSDPNNPTNPETRYIPYNPFNPANQFNQDNSLNPGRSLTPLNRPSGADR